jgi:hypothetical protein
LTEIGRAMRKAYETQMVVTEKKEVPTSDLPQDR